MAPGVLSVHCNPYLISLPVCLTLRGKCRAADSVAEVRCWGTRGIICFPPFDSWEWTNSHIINMCRSHRSHRCHYKINNKKRCQIGKHVYFIHIHLYPAVRLLLAGDTNCKVTNEHNHFYFFFLLWPHGFRAVDRDPDQAHTNIITPA